MTAKSGPEAGKTTAERNTAYPNTAFAAPATLGLSVQGATMISMLAGLWVAISGMFFALQTGVGNTAMVHNIIIGLAVAALGMFALSSGRGATGLQTASAVLGVWLIISPFLFMATIDPTAGMYWSNIVSGAVILVLSIGSGSLSLRSPG